jgi:hypothetical protein
MIDFPVDNPKEVFVLLDYDNTGELTIEEFIKGCLRMKGPAMSKDLLVAQVAIDGMAKQYQLFENELASFKKKTQEARRHGEGHRDPGREGVPRPGPVPGAAPQRLRRERQQLAV